MKLPTLYKKTSTGAIQEWTIETDHLGKPGLVAYQGIIITRHGQVGGKIQETRDVIKEGKNPGKANATTPFEQADKEAQAKWEKQLKKGYVKTIEAATAGEVDEVIEGGVVPMLAHRFDEQGHKITYPAYAQPKFDGHRCIAVIEAGVATLWTRTRKQITGLPHIVAALEAWGKKARRPIVLDGELYNHDYRNNFEELTSFIRTPDAKPGHEVVQYHIYDVAANDTAFADRHSILSTFKLEAPLVAVETIEVADEDELMLAFERFISEGYEGAMVRNAEGKYVNKRSYDLQKVKEFADAEFQIVGVEEGRGKLAGHAIFVCVTAPPVGTEFRVKMKGETSQLKKYFDNPKLVVNKMLTVKYQGITNKSGVPRFPVGLRIREDL